MASRYYQDPPSAWLSGGRLSIGAVVQLELECFKGGWSDSDKPPKFEIRLSAGFNLVELHWVICVSFYRFCVRLFQLILYVVDSA